MNVPSVPEFSSPNSPEFSRILPEFSVKMVSLVMQLKKTGDRRDCTLIIPTELMNVPSVPVFRPVFRPSTTLRAGSGNHERLHMS